VWGYVALAVGALVALRLVARIVFASERVAAGRSEHRENRDLRERLQRYTAR
jgi:nanoRNase/pAp phosphatase (c-di-AMP/oligoRNAs hydrolase)